MGAFKGAIKDAFGKAGAWASEKLGATAHALGCSFAAGTLVVTKGGLKPIESIKEGDYVLARDERTGKESWKRVVGTFARWHDDALNLTLTDEAVGKTETIIVTTEHPFQLKRKGWTAAGRLKAGDEVEASSGRWVRVAAVARLGRRLIAYNMEVQEFHTYFVGNSEIWVHNDCIPWSSASVRSAATKLLNGASSITVKSKAEAEELFLRLFQGKGYRNSTGMSGSEAKNFFENGKYGTYHWDTELDSTGRVVGHGPGNPDGDLPHLQIHDEGGNVTHVFFPPDK